MFKGFDFVSITEQEIDVVVCIHETVLLIRVDVEVLRMTCCQIGNSLIRYIDLHLSLAVSSYACKEFLLEFATHYDRKYEAVEEVVAMDVGTPRLWQ